MKPLRLCLILATILSAHGFGQQLRTTDQHAPQRSASPAHGCGSDELRTYRMGLWPEEKSREDQMNQRIHSIQGSARSRTEIRYIPVVVHVVHIDGPENISDEIIQQGIADLNDAFANAGAYYSLDGVDTHIRFCLAQTDPQGLPSTGITRTFNFLTNVVMESNDDANLKAIDAWDPLLYLNIWLVSEIQSTSMGLGVAGYAQLPYAHGSAVDGIVNEARWFGANSDYSKVHIHEVGHYLGLYHTFQGGCANNDCTMEGDLVCDTPPDANTGAFSCDTPFNSCDTDEDDLSTNNPFRSITLGGLGDQPDLMENYMDYSSQICQTLFTTGQSERMNDALTEVRYSLLTSQGCFNSCGIGLVNFENPPTEVPSGNILSLTPSVFASINPTFQWLLNGQLIGTGSSLNYTFTDAQAGFNTLVFSATHPDGTCSSADSITVYVRCSVRAGIERTPIYADVNALITFSPTQSSAASYQWYLDDAVYAGTPSTTAAFAVGGEHNMVLIASNGICSDTSDVMPFVVGNCYARYDNHWIFGSGSGIEMDFSSGQPTVSAVPVSDTNGLQTIEGIAAISDRNGELLFYSDGIRLYNKNHEPFFDGLGAGFSSAQGVQIVPDPGNENRYYVFTAENFAGMAAPTFRGFAYLTVDMTLNNGLGGVEYNYTTLLAAVTERQTAIRHCNGHDIWVICHEHNNDKFYSYLITDEGLQAPVITQVGPVMDYSWFLGYMVGSPQGNRLAVTSWSGIQLYDFDTSTGIISASYPMFSNSYFQPVYGACFSSDGSKLYFNNGENGPIIRQVDLSSGIDQIMANSIQEIGVSNRPFYLGAMCLGPDDKIYIAQSSGGALDVIHSPNSLGEACQFEPGAITVPGTPFYGLNNVLSAPINSLGPEISGMSQVCPNAQNVPYTTQCNNNVWTYRGSGTFEITTANSVLIDFGAAGIDTLICTSSNACSGTVSDTLLIYVGRDRLFLGNDTTICSTGSLALQANDLDYVSYQWSNGSVAPSITVQTAGTYWLRATAYGGCIYRDTIRVFTFNAPFDVDDTSALVCDAERFVSIANPYPQYDAHWFAATEQPQDVLTFYLYAGSGSPNLPVYYSNDQGCFTMGYIQLVRRSAPPEPFLPASINMCANDVELIHFEQSAHCSFTWQDGSQDNPYTIYNQGNSYYSTYSLLRYDSLCTTYSANTVQVYIYDSTNYTLPENVEICPGVGTTLYILGYYPNYEWQDGSTDYMFNVTSPGVYWVNTETPCGTFSDTTIVRMYQSPPMGLPDSLDLCASQLPYVLQPNPLLYNYYWSNGSNGLVFDPGSIVVTAFDQCGWQRDTVVVSVLPSPVETLPATLAVCNADQVTIGLPPDQINFWNGVPIDSITVNEPGIQRFIALLPNGCTIADSISVAFSSLFFSVTDTTFCQGSALEVIPQTNASSFWWLGPLATDTLIVMEEGAYYAVATNGICTNVFNFNFAYRADSTNVLNVPDSLQFCSNQFPILVEANAPEATAIQWSNGSTNTATTIDLPGWNSVTATYACGQKSDSVFVALLPSPFIQLPNDTVLCKNSTIELNAPEGYDYLWSTGDTTSTVQIDTAEEVYILISNAQGCTAVDSMLVLPSSLYATLPNDVVICPNVDTLVWAQTNGDSYAWSNGADDLSTLLQAEGIYVFQSTLDYCSITDTLVVRHYPASNLSLGADTLVNAAPYFLQAPLGFSNYWWENANSSASILEVNSEGLYTLVATDTYGCTYRDAVYVAFADNSSFITVPSIFFEGNELVAAYRNVSVYDVKVFDSAGRLVSFHRNFPLIWDGKMNGASAAAGMYYYVINYTDAAQQKKAMKGKTQLVK